MTVTAEAEVIQHMLNDGHLSRTDESGYEHDLYGVCPDDGARAPIHRVSRVGSRIFEVILRCPVCGHDFALAPEAMHVG